MADSTHKRSIFKKTFSRSSHSKQPDLHVVSLDSVSTTSSRASGESTRSFSKGSAASRLRKASTPVSSRDTKGNSKARAKSVPHNESLLWERDKQTGEIVDHTEMLHSLGLNDDKNDDFVGQTYHHEDDSSREPGEQVIAKLTTNLWHRIISSLDPADVASITLSCKSFHKLVDREVFSVLNQSQHHREKTRFLSHLDHHLPDHLLCFSCAKFHRRLQPGRESLKPTNVLNPIFACPHMHNPSKRVSRIRLTTGRTIPFTFVQLVTRSARYTSRHGIPLVDLSRRYKDHEPSLWSHNTRFELVEGHLLMRVISTCFPPPPPLPPAALRRLLYTPNEDYNPYFSVCPHWRDGNLMPAVKHALGHIPEPLTGGGPQRVVDNVDRRFFHPINPIVTLCPEICRPMRRCPHCPTEYLIEVKMAEDRVESDPRRRFKQALVVTRWSDLGDGSGPFPELSKEWAAVSGCDIASVFPKGSRSRAGGFEGDEMRGEVQAGVEPGQYDSFAELGKRAISGTFEAESTTTGDTLPGQRMINMNPQHDKKGEAGHSWY